MTRIPPELNLHELLGMRAGNALLSYGNKIGLGGHGNEVQILLRVLYLLINDGDKHGIPNVGNKIRRDVLAYFGLEQQRPRCPTCKRIMQ